MNLIVGKYILYYFTILSIVGFGYTFYDKRLAIHRSHKRIPEATLMFIGAIGGALSMFVTMLVIHHKTKYKKFMIGLPVMILVHAAIVFLLLKFVKIT